MTQLADTYLGQYSGKGRWRDGTGASHAYDVTCAIARTGQDLTITFTHVFHEEPDTADVHLDLTLSAVAPSILEFSLGPVSGRGYEDSDLLHYDIPLPGNLVEATYRFDGDTCLVSGSSERNSAGHHIMWTERLTRTGRQDDGSAP